MATAKSFKSSSKTKEKIKEGDAVLLVTDTGKTFLKKVELVTFHSEWGPLELKRLIGKSYGCEAKTGTGRKFSIIRPDSEDLIRKKLKRGPQIIHKKDIGLMLTTLGLSKDSVVLEAGAGSAFLTAHLARIVRSVETYEIRKSHYEIAEGNIKALGLDNVKIKCADVCGAKGKDFDAIILDLPEPEKVIEKVWKKLRSGGRIAVYSPCMEQSVAARRKLEGLGFRDIRTVELLIREWEAGDCVRPRTQMIGHTGFVVFGRRIR